MMTSSRVPRSVTTGAVAAFFFIMGWISLADPGFTLSFFIDAALLTTDLRNEVRAVYGGYGVAIAALLLWGSRVERRRPAFVAGIRMTVGVALCGMAMGRLLSSLIERPVGPWPLIFLTVEVALALMLFHAVG